ncbi:aldehyde dehydrogenase family protein [Endozoicomonas numazuensis]|uniref:Aldehyde dehydrogenase n=1 Tax=Endozoicomonas numazuensis TaxID=1137799 RepID=A0A081N172_9GAMM|nr:aldehyde dehydrogenase family protein [Endozoicomonas numazuensis]KEQ12195.1 aldehyde dehydrogenase [Endozoicomonas numazuensis]
MESIQKTVSPVDGSIYVERELASGDQVDKTLLRALSAQEQWRSLPLEERVALCSRAVDCFVDNKDQIADEITWQMGRPIQFSGGEVSGFEERARFMLDAASSALKPIVLPKRRGFDRYIKREPLGVVLVIAPWNYPYLTAVNSIVPALVAGNAVIIKHSAQTPLCAERMVEAFLKAGVPEGVFQFLHMSHEETRHLIQSGGVRHVAFTGSVPAGKEIEKAAAGQFISVGLELGGKDPAYIREDADLDVAVESVLDGVFFNSGQSCCGIERIYVHQSIYDDFLKRAETFVNQYKLGPAHNPETTLGPMVRTSAAEFVRQQVAEAVEQGAQKLINEKKFPQSNSGTPYLAPQLLVNVNHSMRIMHEESFGPVAGIMKVSSDEEAMKLMNDSDFGLTAAIYTQDLEKGVELGDQIETGTFFINRCDYLDPSLAWTGVKQSGRGCTLSELGFEAVTRPKSYHVKQV